MSEKSSKREEDFTLIFIRYLNFSSALSSAKLCRLPESGSWWRHLSLAAVRNAKSPKVLQQNREDSQNFSVYYRFPVRSLGERGGTSGG